VRFIGTEGIEFVHRGGRSYTIACSRFNTGHVPVAVLSKSYIANSGQISASHPRKISAFDIAPDGSQYATGYDDGSIAITPTISTSLAPNAYTTSKPHVSSITSLRFFPSSRVLLTSSIDFSLSILPAEPLSPTSSSQTMPTRVAPARTFKGHSRAITSTSIISRGRTILSGSKDGTLRIWDVSSGAQIRTLGTSNYSAIASIASGERGEGAFERPPDGGEPGVPLPPDAREVETEGKIVACALHEGTFQIFDLSTKLSVFGSAPVSKGNLQSIAYSPEASLIATGSSKGLISLYDTRALGSPLTTFQRNNASIEDLVFISPIGDPGGVGLAVGNEDGLPYVAAVRPEGPSVVAELIGSDCDPVRFVRVGPKKELWTAADDGIIRKYSSLAH